MYYHAEVGLIITLERCTVNNILLKRARKSDLPAQDVAGVSTGEDAVLEDNLAIDQHEFNPDWR